MQNCKPLSNYEFSEKHDIYSDTKTSGENSHSSMVAYFCHHLSDNYVDSPDLYVDQRRIQHRRTGRAPRVWKILRVFFFYVESIIHINFIVINMQCLLYAFNYLLLLQKHKVCVKGHQNNLQNPKTIPRLDRAPRFLNSWIRYCWPSSYLCRLARSLYRLVRENILTTSG